MSMSFAMFGPVLDYNYRYTFASELAANSKGERLHWRLVAEMKNIPTSSRDD